MHFMKLAGLMALVPATMFLMISFFVLLGASKAEGKGLKSFGKVIAVLLWLCSLMVFTGGMVMTAKGGPMHMMMNKAGMMQDMAGCPGMDKMKMMEKMGKTAPETPVKK
jgi:hypothetical protein